MNEIAIAEGEFFNRYILRESCSQFDSLPLTSLTIAIAEALFECFQCSSVRLVRSGETSIVAFGEYSGVVVDGGHDFIHIVPVLDMCALTYANVFLPLGGDMLTKRLQRTLHARGFAFGLDAVEAVKKQACCVRPAKRASERGAGDSGLEPKLVALSVSFLLYTVTFYANLAHSLTRSP